MGLGWLKSWITVLYNNLIVFYRYFFFKLNENKLDITDTVNKNTVIILWMKRVKPLLCCKYNYSNNTVAIFTLTYWHPAATKLLSNLHIFTVSVFLKWHLRNDFCNRTVYWDRFGEMACYILERDFDNRGFNNNKSCSLMAAFICAHSLLGLLSIQ